ncbi:hypothetical protein AN958_06112 [Leucoagaricus sp. SymC.cos]|nr:hypothetical protein AN958_06112 [Leucoagaricus sp. SymC.cos]
MHANPPDAKSGGPVRVDIFATCPLKAVTLKTKPGNVPAIFQDSGRVLLQVPIEFKGHESIDISWFKAAQQNLTATDYGSRCFPCQRDGLCSSQTQLREALKNLQTIPKIIKAPWLGEWQFMVLYAFYKQEDGVVRTRMFRGIWEDAATGAAASTLGSWLGKQKGRGMWRIGIVQGVEVGRRSDIEVQVEVGSDGEVKKIELGGEVMEGSVAV